QTGCYLGHYGILKEIHERYLAATNLYQTLTADRNATPAAISSAAKEVLKYSRVLILEDDNFFGRMRPENVTVRHSPQSAFSSALTRKNTGKIFYQAMQTLP